MAAKKAPARKKPVAGKPSAAKRAGPTSTERAAAKRVFSKASAKRARELAKVPTKAAKEVLATVPAKAKKVLAKAALEKHGTKQVPTGSRAKRPARQVSAKDKAQSADLTRPADTEAIGERLARAIPDATCELRFNTPFELLIATILSAQSTDKMVNAVMPTLLQRYPDANALAQAAQEEVEGLVKRTGFFRNKAKSIRGAAQRLVADHEGQVPKTLEALIELPGVARKTANVVLGTAYRITTGVVVDTHVTRVAQRLALTTHDEAQRIEQDLSARFPRDSWIDLGHRLVLHGRYTCLARNPLCSACPLNELCPSRQAEPEGSWEQRAQAEATRVSAGFASSAT